MQYVGQTGRSLKTRFREHFRKMKKPKKFDTFLYRHFKNNGHPPSKIVIQPVEKIIYDPNSSTRLLCRVLLCNTIYILNIIELFNPKL